MLFPTNRPDRRQLMTFCSFIIASPFPIALPRRFPLTSSSCRALVSMTGKAKSVRRSGRIKRQVRSDTDPSPPSKPITEATVRHASKKKTQSSENLGPLSESSLDVLTTTAVEMKEDTFTEVVAQPASEEAESNPPMKKKARTAKEKLDAKGNGEASPKKKRVKVEDIVVIDEALTREAERERAWGFLKEKSVLKVVTWNVASLRSVVKSGTLQSYMDKEGADLVCLQETKMTEEAVKEFNGIEGYEVLWNHSEKKGYSGVALFLRDGLEGKVVVKRVERGMGLEEADKEGRVIRVEFEGGLVIVNAYVPNSGGKLARLGFRTEMFEPEMRKFLDSIKAEGKRVLYCGDLNVAHEVIDIHNSKGNQKSSGHTPQEREQFSIFLKSGEGWADSYRRIYPGVRGYTYYSRRFGDRLKREGKGWRLDYHLIDEESFEKGVVKDIYVRKDVEGSDHYPLVLEYRL